MWSDWIRAGRDKDILYLKLIELADNSQNAALRIGGQLRKIYDHGVALIAGYCRLIRGLFVAALVVTGASVGTWVGMHHYNVRTPMAYQALLILVGLSWALLLLAVVPCVSAVEALAAQVKIADELIKSLKKSIVSNLRVPALIALITILLVILMARVPSLREPGALLTLLTIGVAFGLANFLGFLGTNVTWMRRFIAIQLALAVLLLLVAPQFPHVTAWLSKHASKVNREIGAGAAALRIDVNPAAPPPFFDAITGEPLYFYSGSPESGYLIWDGPGFDPETREELKSINSPEVRERILRQLRQPPKKEVAPLPLEPSPPPRPAPTGSAVPRGQSGESPKKGIEAKPDTVPTRETTLNAETPSFEEEATRARAAFDAGNHGLALQHAERALKTRPTDSRIREIANTAATQLARASCRHEEERILKIPTQKRSRIQTLLQEGATASAAGQWDKARNVYTFLLETDQNNFEANKGLAVALLQSGHRFEEALSALYRAAAVSPGDAETRLLSALALARLSRYERARDMVLEAIYRGSTELAPLGKSLPAEILNHPDIVALTRGR